MKIIDNSFLLALARVRDKISIDIKPFCENNLNYRPAGEGVWLFSKRKIVNFLSESAGGDYFVYTGKYSDAEEKAKEWAKSQNLNSVFLIDKGNSIEELAASRVR